MRRLGCEREAYLALQFDLLLIGVRSVPLGQTGLALAILHENERQNHLRTQQEMKGKWRQTKEHDPVADLPLKQQ